MLLKLFRTIQPQLQVQNRVSCPLQSPKLNVSLIPTLTINSKLTARLFSVTSVYLNSDEPARNSSKMEVIEQKIKLAEDVEINYGKIGHGPQVVLCIPGMFGTIESDFEPIMKKFDHDKFTVLCMEQLGYGKSRPHKREFGNHASAKDAKVVELLMKTLEIPKYSIIGWSAGGGTGLLVATNKNSNVEKFIFWGLPAFIDESMRNQGTMMLNPANWIPERWESMSKLYGEPLMFEMLNGFNDYVQRSAKLGTYRFDLELVKVPTLIFHGENDMSNPIAHPATFHKGIVNSILQPVPKGKHDHHLQFPDQFVRRVERFLLTGR